jgi:hypothetical protein
MDIDNKNGAAKAGQNPMEQWLQTLNFFEATPNEAHLDDTVYLIKQYARLQISSLKQLQRDYKDLFGQECPPKMKRNDVILALLGRIQEDLYQQLDPNTLPNHMTGIDFNEDALKHVSRGRATRLVPGTVIERDYQGKTYVVFCRDGYYEYNQKRYGCLSDISEEITGYKFSGPLFFTRKSRMYLL